MRSTNVRLSLLTRHLARRSEIRRPICFVQFPRKYLVRAMKLETTGMGSKPLTLHFPLRHSRVRLVSWLN